MGEYYNKEYYNKIKGNCAYIDLSPDNIKLVMRALYDNGIPFSASYGGYRNTITVHNDDKQRALEIANANRGVNKASQRVIGNTEYKSIKDRHYINTSAEIAMQVSAILSGDSSIKFSGVLKEKSATLTVSGAKNAEMVNRIIDNVKNADILNELAQAGFERMPDSNNFVVIRNMSTGETAGFKNMAIVRNMWNDRSNEFFHAPVYAVDKAAENAEPFYISDTDGFEEIGVYVDENGTAPTFPTEENAVQYAESNNISLANADDPPEHLETVPETAFEYGGYHFVPVVGQAVDFNADDFKFATRNLKHNTEIDLSVYSGKYDYAEFYKASGGSSANLFKCIETGGIYVPGDNELFEYTGEIDYSRQIAVEKPEAHRDGIIDINRDLIDSFEQWGNIYADVLYYDDREAVYTWIHFDEHTGEDGTLIEKTFTEEDVYEAYLDEIEAETETSARDIFISDLNDRAKERRYSVSDPEFTECAERYIHLPVRGEALSVFSILEGSTAITNVENFIEYAEKNCTAVREDKAKRERENAKNAVVDACYERLKTELFEDEAVKTALDNDSYDDAHNVVIKQMNAVAMSIFNEDARSNVDFYIDFFGETTTAKNIDFVDYVTKTVRQSIETRDKTAVFSENDDIIIDGKEGTWHVAATAEIHSKKLYELESDNYGYTPEVGHIIVDGRKKVVSENVHNGFLDIEIPSKPEMAFYIKNNDEYIAATNNHMTVSDFLELFANTEYKDLFKMLNNNGVMTNEIRFAEVSQSQNGIGVEVDINENNVTVIGADTLVTFNLDDVRDKYYNSPIHFGFLGNGTTVYDTSRRQDNDYPIVAHISEEGVINYFDRDNIAEADIRRIERQAAQAKNKFVDEWNKLDNAVKYDVLLNKASVSQIVDITSLYIPSAEVVKIFEHSIVLKDEPYPDIAKLKEKYADGQPRDNSVSPLDEVIQKAESADVPVEHFSAPETAAPEDKTLRNEMLLHEVMHGSGFESGKQRISEFYNAHNSEPKFGKSFADFLKNEYGIGGHSGDDVILMQNHDSKGISLEYMENDIRRKVNYSWNEVGKAISQLISEGKYTPEQAPAEQTRDNSAVSQEEPEQEKAAPEFREVPLYTEAFAYARRTDEVDLYRISNRENEACAKAIDKYSTEFYNGYIYPSEDVLNAVLAEFPAERVEYIVAANISDASYDGRLSRANIEWAEKYMDSLPEEYRRLNGIYLHTHKGLLDMFATAVHKYMEQQREAEKAEAVNALRQQLIEKVETELADFLANPNGASEYQINTKKDLADFISGNTSYNFSEEQYAALLSRPHILSEIYEEFRNADMDEWDEENMITFLSDTAASITESLARDNSALERAKAYITDYLADEFESVPDFTDMRAVSIGYTELGENNEYPFQAEADLVEFNINYFLDSQIIHTDSYDSLEEMNKKALSLLDFNDIMAVGNNVLDERNPDEVAKALDLYRNHITFSVITIEGEKPVVSGRTYVDREDITELDEYQDYILRTGKRFADVTVEYYDIGNDEGNEAFAAEDGEVIYIQEHLDEVINHTGCIVLETKNYSVDTPDFLLEEYAQENSVFKAAENGKIQFSLISYGGGLEYYEAGHITPETLKDTTAYKDMIENIGYVDKAVCELTNYEFGSGDIIPVTHNMLAEIEQNFEEITEKAAVTYSETVVLHPRWQPVPETADDNGRITSYSAKVDGTFYWISENSDHRYDIETSVNGTTQTIYNGADFASRADAEEYFEEYISELRENAYKADEIRIYQVKSGDEYREKRFVDLPLLPEEPNIDDYDLVYTGSLSALGTDDIDGLYAIFNNNHPTDFKGRSMSVGDVVVLHNTDIQYVDGVGFSKLPETFFDSREEAEKKIHLAAFGFEVDFKAGQRVVITENWTEGMYDNIDNFEKKTVFSFSENSLTEDISTTRNGSWWIPQNFDTEDYDDTIEDVSVSYARSVIENALNNPDFVAVAVYDADGKEIYSPEKSQQEQTDSDIHIVTPEVLGEVIETREPREMFLAQEGERWVAVDNRTGDAWTEDFGTKEAAMLWLDDNELTVEDIPEAVSEQNKTAALEKSVEAHNKNSIDVRLADKLLEYEKEFDFYDFHNNMKINETEEEMIQDLIEQIYNQEECEGIFNFISENKIEFENEKLTNEIFSLLLDFQRENSKEKMAFAEEIHDFIWDFDYYEMISARPFLVTDTEEKLAAFFALDNEEYRQGVIEHLSEVESDRERYYSKAQELIEKLKNYAIHIEQEKDSEQEHNSDEHSKNEITPELSAPEKEAAEVYTPKLGDKFKDMWGAEWEIVSLTGALPWYTDQCAIQSINGGFNITKNESYTNLLDPKFYTRVADVPEKAYSPKIGDVVDWDGEPFEVTAIEGNIVSIVELDEAFPTEHNFKLDDMIKRGILPLEMKEQKEPATPAEEAAAPVSESKTSYTPKIGDMIEMNDALLKVADISGSIITFAETESLFGNTFRMSLADFLSKDFSVYEENAEELAEDIPAAEPQEKAAEVIEIKNLAQLKRVLTVGAELEMTSAVRPDVQGQLRRVNYADTTGMYTIRPDVPDDPKTTLANDGKGSYLHWGKSGEWEFNGAACSRYAANAEHTPENLILHFTVTALAPEQQRTADVPVEHQKKARPYQIITYDEDSGFDEKREYATLKEARKGAQEYLKDNYDGMGTPAYEGYSIYNKETKIILETGGHFPIERGFSSEVLRINGYTKEADEMDERMGRKKDDTLYTYDLNDPDPSKVKLKSVVIDLSGRTEQAREADDPVEHREENPLEVTPELESEVLNLFESLKSPFTPETEEQLEKGLQELFDDTPAPKGQNFVITDEKLGEFTPKVRYKANIEAIRTLKTIEEERRTATPEEQQILSGYTGWGAIPDVFDSTKNDWRKEYAELKELLTDEEYTAARKSTMNAHYTSPTVISAIYDGLANMGFESGKVLEPAMGIGNFFGVMPENMRESELHGVELDSVSGRMAKLLYPNADIQVKGFENTSFENGSFDVVVGNVPFGDYKVDDKDYNKHKFLIHDYFIAKAIDKVRPGGILAVVTSKGTMDKESDSLRKYAAQRAELLGAIRLPNTAFKQNAGTEVTPDILFFQKRERPIEINPAEVEWLGKAETEDGLSVNNYFLQHPEMVLGKIVRGNKLYGDQQNTTECVPIEGADLKQQLAEAIKNIKGEYKPVSRTAKKKETEETIPAPPDSRVFSYYAVDGAVYFRAESEDMTKVNLKGDSLKRALAMIEIRENVRELLDLQLNNADGSLDGDITASRQLLNERYDAFVAKYGHFDDKKNVRVLKGDDGYNFLTALEEIDKDNEGVYKKAAIFTKDTVKPNVIVRHVETAQEALIMSVAEKAKVDFEYMTELCGLDKEMLISELEGQIYRLPQEEEKYVTADEYLTGNIRVKLHELENAPADMDISGHKAALEAAMPKRVEAKDITVKLGSHWVDPKFVTQFITQKFSPGWRSQIEVQYSKASGRWKIEGATQGDKHGYTATHEFGTMRRNAYNILEGILNHDDLTVKDDKLDEYGNPIIDSNGKHVKVTNQEETKAVQTCVRRIENEWADWIFKDPDRREALVTKYNEVFNSIRQREYDGSHLSFVGMNSEITLKEHQKNAVARALYGGNTLLAHAVGGGKTFEMVTIAMEGKRLGLHSKCLFAVPNSLTEQIGRDFKKLYPAANVLVATKKDFEAKNRKTLFARIATGEWDAVIVGHSQLDRMGLSAVRVNAYMQAEIEALREELDEAIDENGKKSFSVKEIEKTIAKYEKKLKDVDKVEKEGFIDFEQMGFDKLFVDECHMYKNLGTATKMSNVAGIGITGSAKAAELLMKARYFDSITGGTGLIFASGTPVSNSMTELYTMMRYLQQDLLNECGIAHFDEWAADFGVVKTDYELKPESDGKYQLKTRFAQFTNLPELMGMFKECADIRTADTLDIEKPISHVHDVVAPPSKIQKRLIKSLSKRATKIREGAVDPREDNMLVIVRR